MGSNEDPSAPLPSFLGCPAISPTGTALWPDQQADGVLGVLVLLELMGRARGVLEQWRREEDGLVGGGRTRAPPRTARRLCSSVGFKYIG